MSAVKMVFQHNYNNFLMSVSMYCHLYKEGSVSGPQLMVGLLKSVRERMKIYHWSLSNF